MKKLKIDLLAITDEEFELERRRYIKEHVSEFGWKKEKAEVTFDEKYPDKRTYKSKTTSLSGFGEQELIDKINEIIDFINKIPDKNIQQLREILKDVG